MSYREAAYQMERQVDEAPPVDIWPMATRPPSMSEARAQSGLFDPDEFHDQKKNGDLDR